MDYFKVRGCSRRNGPRHVIVRVCLDAWNLYVVAVLDIYSCSQEESLKLHKDLPVKCLETLSKSYMTKLFFY